MSASPASLGSAHRQDAVAEYLHLLVLSPFLATLSLTLSLSRARASHPLL